MTVVRAFLIVIGSSLFFGAAGATIGTLLEMYVPQYYQVVFFRRAKNIDDYRLVGARSGCPRG